MKLLIVQPWFTAIGHPAQSVLNLASALGKNGDVDYLVSENSQAGSFSGLIEKLRGWGKVESFPVTTEVGESNTFRALLALWRMRLQGSRYQRVYFADESLYTLALYWPLFALLVGIDRLCVLHLFGPEMGPGRMARWRRFVIGKFLRRRDVRFYLRTEELAVSWRKDYKMVGSEHIRYLPSLEIPDEEPRRYPEKDSKEVAFGIIGQIRFGKGIEWLVPVFQNNKHLGNLTVAGEFNTPQTRLQLSVLDRYEGFVNKFMTEEEMMERVAQQDYLLMLYDQWDKRMESAVLYLAARVNRPVIVYGDSWSGRMVREFGCGLAVSEDRKQIIELLAKVPRPESVEYRRLLKGMEAFRQAYSAKSLRDTVVQEILG